MKKKMYPSLKIVKIGTICQEASEMASSYNLLLKSELGIGGGSTAVLIQGEKNILVDTGFDFEWLDTAANIEKNSADFAAELMSNDIKPDDIDIVFITHWDRDHFGNLDLFKKSRFMAAKPMVKRFHLDKFTGINDGEELTGGVKAVFTPGHTIDHASIIVQTEYAGIKIRIAVAGDAIISHSYFQAGVVWKNNADFFDIKASTDSISRLISLSDVIIPGHGTPFMTYKPNTAR